MIFKSGNARPMQCAAWLALVAGLGGCASTAQDQSIAKANATLKTLGQGPLALTLSADQTVALTKKSSALLANELAQNQAVELALTNSPQFQVLLAQAWVDSAMAAQSGRIANPLFLFERTRIGSELELARLFSFGLLDLLTLPARAKSANARVEQVQLQLVANLVDQVTLVRTAWVKAVGAQQSFLYAEQVFDSAQASAELAKRMLVAGNFNKIMRARQQVFYADAATQLALSQAKVSASREQLVRALGLTDAQALLLKIPQRLPDLPKAPRQPEDVSAKAAQQRIDVQMSQAMLRIIATQQGLKNIESWTDIEVGFRRDTVFEGQVQNAGNPALARRGFEVGVRLPIFDSGELKRELMTAQMLAAISQTEATVRAANSHLRESYSNYRTAWDIAQHYREEIIPLRKLILDENVLRYNGMIIGVFDLLADSREQIRSVIAAIEAEQQFWLNDVAIQTAILGKPATMSLGQSASSASDSPAH